MKKSRTTIIEKEKNMKKEFLTEEVKPSFDIEEYRRLRNLKKRDV